MLQQLIVLAGYAKCKVRDLLSDEKGEVNIVAIVVLIGIAVLLALIFKDQISGLLESLINTIKGQATDAVTKK
ncbi:MAG: flagellin-like protein [Ruminococcus sp.]|nr:flagellin-like protein [Ruminococcus sp.]